LDKQLASILEKQFVAIINRLLQKLNSHHVGERSSQ